LSANARIATFSISQSAPSPLLSLHLPPHYSPFLYPSLPSLRSRPVKIQLEDLGQCCKLPSGVWDKALAEVDFGAYYP